jgi:hypothetical protein
MIAPTPKTDHRLKADPAKGGTTKMLPKQAANTQKPGGTAHAVKGGAPGPKHASGGPVIRGVSTTKPARAGHTAPVKKGR